MSATRKDLVKDHVKEAIAHADRGLALLDAPGERFDLGVIQLMLTTAQIRLTHALTEIADVRQEVLEKVKFTEDK